MAKNSKELRFLRSNHISTKRNYLERMNDNKIVCMIEAKKYGKNYWDGKRRFGYGGYKYIPNRLTKIAKRIIKKFNLTNKSKILDVGCGKGYLLYEIKKIIPYAKIIGIDSSSYAIKNAKKEIKKNIFLCKAEQKYPFKRKYFDLALSFGCFHNLEINNLKKALNEIQRVSKKKYLCVESYRNELEKQNLIYWQVTCEMFCTPEEWKWWFKLANYNGDYSFIYFE